MLIKFLDLLSGVPNTVRKITEAYARVIESNLDDDDFDTAKEFLKKIEEISSKKNLLSKNVRTRDMSKKDTRIY